MNKPAKPSPQVNPPEIDRRDPEPIEPAHHEAVVQGLAEMHTDVFVTDQSIDETFNRFIHVNQ